VLLLLLACSNGGGTDSPGPEDTAISSAGCPSGVVGEVAGALDEADLTEASGLVLSPGRPGLLWAHNDSGGASELFGLDGQGRLVQRVAVTGATATDWEDLAAGLYEGQPTLFIGDVGDNGRSRQDIALWRVPEPAEGATTAAAVRHGLLLPDGARDIEALLLDPLSGDVLVVTKELASVAQVLRGAAPLGAEIPLVLESELSLTSFPGVTLGAVTAGDISPDGRCIYLRTYTQVLAWERVPGASVAATLTLAPTVMPSLTEPQGEALAADADGYWTLSEGEGAPLHRFQGAP